MGRKKVKADQPLTTAQRLGSLIKSARDIMRKDKGLNGDLDRLPMLTWIMFVKFLDDMEQLRDLGRLEAANIGVLLFCPERHFLKALTTKNNRRIIHFFGSEGHDWARINAFKKGLQDRLALEGPEIETLAQLERFIGQRANLLQITPPRPMKVTNPEEDLENLYRELIGGSPRRTSTQGLKRHIGERLMAAGLSQKIQRDIVVQVPVLEKDVEIPFGFQNGRFNLINPVTFESAEPERSVATACKYAVEGHSLHEHPDPRLGKLQLIIVGKFRSEDQESPGRVRRVLEDYEVRLYRTTELPQLIDEIRRTGKDLGQPTG